MKVLFPMFSLGAAAFAIVWTPWPTAKEMFSPRSNEWIQDAPTQSAPHPNTFIAQSNDFRRFLPTSAVFRNGF